MSPLRRNPYFAYLLRAWRPADVPAEWSFSLEDPRTGVRRGFATLAELLTFLETHMEEINEQLAMNREQ